MAKRQIVLDQKAIDERVRKGAGQGHGAHYVPWILAPSTSLDSHKYRTLGWKTGREHHLLSSLEFDVFCLLDWSPTVLDIREQFPLLPLSDTLSIATQMRIPHPHEQFRRASPRKYIVMTTDLLIDIQTDTGVRQVALDIKPSGELDKRRTLEKLELARRYWAARNVDWGIITEFDYSSVMARNLREKIRPYRSLEGQIDLPSDEINELARALTTAVRSGNHTLTKTVRIFDQEYNLPAGYGVTLVRYLIATRQWTVDLTAPLHLNRKLSLLSTVFDDYGEGAI